MPYKLASRDNINSEVLEVWPAVFDKSFTKFNNNVEKTIFNSETDILNWLESKSRTKSKNRDTNIQIFRNGDPNKLYSVYRCDHDTVTHGNDIKDIYIYSLRYRRPSEAYSTFMNENGVRINSSFKKINIGRHVEEQIDYSTDVCEIRLELFEGIYPLDIDKEDEKSREYMEFVSSIHKLSEDKDSEYSIIYAEDSTVLLWLDIFLKKMELIEKFLEFFAAGGNIYVSLNVDAEHDAMTEYILKILSEHRESNDDLEVHGRLRNVVVNPILATGTIYQVRYDKTFLTWHVNYRHMINKYKFIPSKKFSELILNFNLSDFFKQMQSKENLTTMIKNLNEMYGIKNKKIISRKLLTKKKKPPKFRKVTKSFMSLNDDNKV